MRDAPLAVLVCLVVATPALGGCLGAVHRFYSFDGDATYVNPGVFNGTYALPDTNGSAVLHKGHAPYGDPEVFRLRSTRPAGDAFKESENAVFIPIAVWKPIDGYYEGRLPVIVDAGPSFEQGRHCWSGAPFCAASDTVPDTIKWAGGYPGLATSFLLKNFLPKGYAVAQVAVRGTGSAGGCMELLGPNEAADLSQAITWLGEQEWSNGNVAMMGLDYDGSTPWLVAATGNEHLKTIVPVGGSPDLFSLLFRNGTVRAADEDYWSYGFSDDFPVAGAPVRAGGANDRQPYQDRQNLLCPDAYKRVVMAHGSSETGERNGEASEFWAARDHRDEVLAHYQGSVFLVHGLQDRRAAPHVAVPFAQRLKDAGIEVKEWFGQWDHTHPDTRCLIPSPQGQKDLPVWITRPCRADYAETLLHWFEYYLRDNRTTDRGPWTQVQDDYGYWRNTASFPSVSADWTLLYAAKPAPGKPGRLQAEPAAPSSSVLAATSDAGKPPQYLEFRTEPFAEDTRISGLPRFHVEFEAMGPTGHLGAWIMDEDPEGKVLDRPVRYDYEDSRAFFSGSPIIGSTQMDLRFYDGGDTAKPLVAGTRYVARMEFEPLDVMIPAGHRLTLWLFQHQTADRSSGVDPGNQHVMPGSPVRIWFGDKTSLQSPTVRVDPRDVFPVPGAHFPRPDLFEKLFRPKPDYPQTLPPLELRAAPAFPAIVGIAAPT